MKFSYNEQKNIFQYGDYEYIPKIPIDAEYNYHEYDIYLFYNNFVSENDIYQVLCESNRIGYIFPVEAIESIEHDKADDKFFLKYAYVAINLLLNMIEQEKIEETINLSDCFPDTQLLIVCKDNLTKKNIDLNDYILSLVEYGYSKKMNVYFPRPLVTLNSQNKTFLLHKIQKDIDSIMYIKEEFYNLLPYKTDNPLIIFHRLYQFIEIFIMELFNKRFLKFVEGLDCQNDDLFQKKEDLDKLTSEKQRVKSLLNQCKNIDVSIKNNLNDACKVILNLYKHKLSEDFATNLYEVRCCLFHSLYKFRKENELYLEPINENLFLMLISIITSISFDKLIQEDS